MTIFQEITNAQSIVDQGDVFADIYFPAIDTRVNAVVVTPTCDFENKKAHFVKFISSVSINIVIKIIADSVGIDEFLFESENPISNKQYIRVIKALRRNTTGDFLPRYYLLPKYRDILPASYVDFQRVFALPFHQVIKEYLDNRVARIVSPWREQIVAQYAAYSMRVGTPEYSNKELKYLLKIVGLKLPVE